MNLAIREIDVADAAMAARLSGELGYPVEAAVLEQRIQSLDRAHHAVLVAILKHEVVGWIDVGEVFHFQNGTYGEIGGLVVSVACRSQGVGARLVASAEAWARGRGLKKMLVRSRLDREGAHRFYLREGYEQTKTSAVFTRNLGQAC